MYKLFIFGGTTEGRQLAEYLSSQDAEVTVSVATEYGETLLPAGEKLSVCSGRMPVGDMIRRMQETRFDLVIDATHPYAAAVTESIHRACEETGTEYLRLLRGGSEELQGAVYVPDTDAAAAFLNTVEGNVLLTTGSKELGKFAGVKGFAERVWARVLPMDSSLASCSGAGLPPAHIIAMQGPFSEELNAAMLRSINAAWIVTKDGGTAGGFMEKMTAAAATGARAVVIGRPPQREGLNYSELLALLRSRFGFARRAEVSIVGIGSGSPDTMTAEAVRACAEADCLIGAARMLEAMAHPGQPTCAAIAPADIAGFIRDHGEYSRFAVVMSGDTGFFSGTKKLLPLLSECRVRVLPGLSSLSCLCARVGESWDDAKVVSAHGRSGSVVPEVRANAKLFVLVGGENGMKNLCRELTEAGLGGVKVCVGEQLGYPEEKVTCGTAAEQAGRSFHTLSVALILNPQPDAIVTHGLPDDAFQRVGGEAPVPMTKSEVRSVCLSRLQLRENSVCWDIGAGTGSVAIEMALQARRGQVYAIERRAEAVELLQENKKKFYADNLTVVSGTAPDACLDLPAPTHAFIGGSAGNMKEIITLLREKNPEVCIVATAIALESIAELTACLKAFPFAETEVVSLSAARDRKAGPYHLMTGQNPITIFTMRGTK